MTWTKHSFACGVIHSALWFLTGDILQMGNLHSTLYTLHSTLYTLHSTLYTLHSTLYTLHSALYTLHSTLYSPLIIFTARESNLDVCPWSESWKCVLDYILEVCPGFYPGSVSWIYVLIKVFVSHSVRP